MRFGLLYSGLPNKGYSLEHIIKHYAKSNVKTPKIDTTEEKEKYIAKLKQYVSTCTESNFLKINETIVLLARAKQWGLDINEEIKTLPELAEKFKITKQFYYALLCLADYAKFSKQLKEHELAEIIKNHFNNATFSTLVESLSIDLEQLWKNPTLDGLNELGLAFTLKEGTYSYRHYRGYNITITLSETTPLYSFKTKKNRLISHPDAKTESNFLFKGEDRFSVGYFMSNELDERAISPCLQHIQEFLVSHITALQKKYELLQSVINEPLEKMQMSEEQKEYVKANIPIILVFVDNEERIEKIPSTNEYQVKGDLILGKHIKIIATDTNENKLTLQGWLAKNKLRGIKIVLFEQLKPTIQPYFNDHDNERLLVNIGIKSIKNEVSPYGLQELYAMSESKGESKKYTIREHTIMALSKLELHPIFSRSKLEYRYPSKWPSPLSNVYGFMRAIVSLHDIGSGLDHDKSKSTLPILKAYLADWGFRDDEIKIAEHLVDQNLLGDLMKKENSRINDLEIEECVSRLKNKAVDCGLDLLTFFKLQSLYYLSVAGSRVDKSSGFMREPTVDFNPFIFKYIPTNDCFIRIVKEVECNMFEQDLAALGGLLKKKDNKSEQDLATQGDLLEKFRGNRCSVVDSSMLHIYKRRLQEEELLWGRVPVQPRQKRLRCDSPVNQPRIN